MTHHVSSQTKTLLKKSIFSDPVECVLVGNSDSPLYDEISMNLSIRNIKVTHFPHFKNSLSYVDDQEDIFIAIEDRLWPSPDGNNLNVRITSWSLLCHVLNNGQQLSREYTKLFSNQLHCTNFNIFGPATEESLIADVINECGGRVKKTLSDELKILFIPEVRPTLQMLNICHKNSKNVIGINFLESIYHPGNSFYNANYKDKVTDYPNSLLSLKFSLPIQRDFDDLVNKLGASEITKCLIPTNIAANSIVLCSNESELHNVDILFIRHHDIIVLKSDFLLDSISENSYMSPGKYLLQPTLKINFRNILSCVLRTAVKITDPEVYNMAIKTIDNFMDNGGKIYEDEETADIVITDSVAEKVSDRAATIYGIRDRIESLGSDTKYFYKPVLAEQDLVACFEGKSILFYSVSNKYEVAFWSALLKRWKGAAVDSPVDSSQFYVCTDHLNELPASLSSKKVITLQFLCDVLKTHIWLDPNDRQSNLHSTPNQLAVSGVYLPSFQISPMHLNNIIVQCFATCGFVEMDPSQETDITKSVSTGHYKNANVVWVCSNDENNVIIGITRNMEKINSMIDRMQKYLQTIGFDTLIGDDSNHETLIAAVFNDGIIPVCRIKEKPDNIRKICVLSDIKRVFANHMPKAIPISCNGNILQCSTCKLLLRCKHFKFTMTRNISKTLTGYNIIHTNGELKIRHETSELQILNESIVKSTRHIYEQMQEIYNKHRQLILKPKIFCSDKCRPRENYIHLIDVKVKHFATISCSKCKSVVEKSFFLLLM